MNCKISQYFFIVLLSIILCHTLKSYANITDEEEKDNYDFFKTEPYIAYEETDNYMDDVETLTVESYNYACPEDSSWDRRVELRNKNGETFSACEYYYICHENEPCLKINSFNSINDFYLDSINYTYGSWLVNKTDENQKKILVSCNQKRANNKLCSTVTCETNADCFSENCVKGICLTNPKKPAYVCRTVKENSEFKVKCLLGYEEKCKNDDECGDGASCLSDKVCVVKREEEKVSYTKYIFIVIFAVIILMLVLLFFFVIKGLRSKNKQKKIDRLNNINTI